MCIHRTVILRNFLEEIHQISDIREYLDSGLHHLCDLLQIQILGNHLLSDTEALLS